MIRHAFITRVKPGRLDEYKALHAAPWPGVLRAITACNIRNYSIFHQEMPGGEHLLFSYLEYTGDDWDADMKKMADDEETRRWWAVCKPCLLPVGDLPEGEVWAPLPAIFFHP